METTQGPDETSTTGDATAEPGDRRARATSGKWVERWRDMVAEQPERPGVWRRRDGGYHVRGRAKDPRTGKIREINRALPEMTKARDASAWLEAEIARVRAGNGGGVEAAPAMPQFQTFAADVFERKVALGKIRAASGRAKWDAILTHHLIPAFGPIYLDQFRPQDVKEWQARVAAKIRAGEMAPATANTILAVLRQISRRCARCGATATTRTSSGRRASFSSASRTRTATR